MKSETAPFDTGELAVQAAIDEVAISVDEDPFAAVIAEAEPENEPLQVDFEDPFAAPVVHDDATERAELEELLANAQALVSALEAALERAHENERALRLRLER